MLGKTTHKPRIKMGTHKSASQKCVRVHYNLRDSILVPCVHIDMRAPTKSSLSHTPSANYSINLKVHFSLIYGTGGSIRLLQVL